MVDYRRDTAFREYAALSSGPSWQNSSGTIWGSGNRLADNKTTQWTAQGKLTGRFEALGRQHDVFATYSYNKRHTDSETMQHWNLWADPSDSWNRFCASRGWPNWCDPNLSRDFPLEPFDGSVIPRPDWSKQADLDYRFNPSTDTPRNIPVPMPSVPAFALIRPTNCTCWPVSATPVGVIGKTPMT